MQGIYELHRDKNENLYYFNGVNSCSPHFHKHLEILFINDGNINIRINDESRELRDGGVAISDSFDVHSYTPIGKSVSTVVIFPFYLLKNYSAYKKDKSLATNFIEKTADNKKIIYLINQFKNATNPLCISGLVDTLLYIITQNTGLIKKDKTNGYLTREILLYIESNYTNEINLASISQHFSYSPTHFSHLFNSSLGVSLNDYINSVRINQLIELKTQNLQSSTADLAFDVGFNSLSTFYRAFIKQTASTPEKYFN